MKASVIDGRASARLAALCRTLRLGIRGPCLPPSAGESLGGASDSGAVRSESPNRAREWQAPAGIPLLRLPDSSSTTAARNPAPTPPRRSLERGIRPCGPSRCRPRLVASGDAATGAWDCDGSPASPAVDRPPAKRWDHGRPSPPSKRPAHPWCRHPCCR